MKKLFAVMIVAAALTACNDNAKTEEAPAADTSTVAPMAAPDTAAAATMNMDSTKVADSATTK